MTCPSCGVAVLEIDVRCGSCGTALGSTGAQRMIGSLVLGIYEVVDVLGQGGMSIVYKGRHKMTEQDVALKILPPELAAHSQVKSRFLEEARALAALDHPNIVHLYNFGQENGCFVLAMQLVGGQTWERMILEAQRLDWQTSTRVAIDVLKALEYAHGRGVVHRDMKPSNVLVRAHDGAATVMDFGIAKMTTSTKLTATGQTMGTVRYMSPEQVRGQEVDARTDIYSLGATMFESLTGDTPFDGNTHFEIMTKHLSEPPKRPSARGIEVPATLEDIVMRSLAKRPEDRWESARDMRKALESALREADVALGSTQRVARDEVVRPPPRAAVVSMPPAAVGTATELADRLEPVDASRPRRGTGLIALIAVISLLAAGGGTAAFLLTRGGKAAVAPVRGEEPELLGGPLTDGTKLRAAYDRSLSKLRDRIGKLGLHGDLKRPVDQVAAVPRGAMCDPRSYDSSAAVPADCGTAVQIIARTAEPTSLLVLDDPDGLQAAMDVGVADAVCTFRTFAPWDEKICDLARSAANGSGVD